MAWWKQVYLAGTAFWAGNIAMYLWFARSFGQLGQSISYVQATLLGVVSVLVLASAFITINLNRTRQSPQSRA